MTHSEMILQHLKTHGSITPLEAMDSYGCMRLGARIYDLKRDGYDIRTERVEAENRRGERTHFARYRMGARS